VSLTHAILGVLSVEPKNGYELSRGFETTLAWVWVAPRSQIYPTLRKMEQEGLIEAERQVRGTKLERRVYHVTDAGLAELRRWVAEPSDTTMKRDPVLLQALFLDMVEPDVAAKFFEHVIDEQQTIVEYGERLHREILANELPVHQHRLARRPPDERAYVAMIKAHVFAGAAAQARARIAWAEEGLRLLAEEMGTRQRPKRSAAKRKA
jgi:DNA-binding PadR family transcriptional regulator